MFSYNQMNRILRDSTVVPDGQKTRTQRFAAAQKSIRRNLITHEQRSEEARLCAAIELQRVWRGYQTRCRLLGVLQPQISTTAIYSGSKHYLRRVEDARSPSPKVKVKRKSKARERLEQLYKDFMNETGSNIGFEDFCASYIQEWWRGLHRHRASSPLTSSTGSQPSSRRVQKRPPKKKKRRVPLSELEATVIIQKAWRRHIDVQVYRYYRDLINFHSRGDPAMMLRCINPTESKMLDAACGIHVKFRLAGERFPPNIYYKIFTHRPVQDLCANSPKDYTQASTKLKMARDVHNKGCRVPGTDQSGWYRRQENNGWRLVSDRLIHHVMSDPITYETSRKTIDFPHDKLKRRQDVERRKKEKKLEWMKKMYREGMLKARSDDQETIELIEGATAGMVATVERLGTTAVQDWEVDELLDWTTSLNFEDYIVGWKDLATSASSEKLIDDRVKVKTVGADPYQLTFGEHESTHPSHNTPASTRVGTGVSLVY